MPAMLDARRRRPEDPYDTGLRPGDLLKKRRREYRLQTLSWAQLGRAIYYLMSVKR